MRHSWSLGVLAALGVGAVLADSGLAQTAGCTPLETRPTTAAGRPPAHPGMTRACAVQSRTAFDVVVVAQGLEHPWAVEPLPGGDFLVTEKPGRMRIVSAAGVIGDPIEGVPPVVYRVQGGLLDVALSPRFETDRTVFWSYTEPRADSLTGTSVARGVLSADRRRLEQVRVIFRSEPGSRLPGHFGSRLAFDRDGLLFVNLGDRFSPESRARAQDVDNHFGKIVRITADGGVPKDNPFVGRAGAAAEVWSYGHRNIQAAAFDTEGRLWEIEHGPAGGDELNLVQKGKNYGWPWATYGQDYSGQPMPNSTTTREGTEQPVYYWDPVIAPSGAQFYTGNAFPEWRGNLFIGGLGSARLVRVVIEKGRVTGEEHLLVDHRFRIRDVRQGPDGLLYLVTDQPKGELVKLVPRK
ncbi:MAG: PQQ-dependent sugar dehydrogenase [Gemmatimonadales bacterium]|nr:PQQ-dependent sugar dehydrogenase [Gemmatimonadales bacterium]